MKVDKDKVKEICYMVKSTEEVLERLKQFEKIIAENDLKRAEITVTKNEPEPHYIVRLILDRKSVAELIGG